MFELSWLCSDGVCLSPKKGHNIYSIALFLGGRGYDFSCTFQCYGIMESCCVIELHGHLISFFSCNILNCPPLRAFPPVLCMSPCTLKSDEEKSKHAGLAQENGLCSGKYAQLLLRLVKGTAKAVNLPEKSAINTI